MTASTRTPTREDFRAAIEEVRTRYAEEGHSLWDIGNGLCEDFASDVLEVVAGEEWQAREEKEGWWLAYTDGLFDPQAEIECTPDRWDWALLRRVYGITVPESERSLYDAVAQSGAAHVWIVHEGRHYDCEHPDGVESFFDLKFFQRYLESVSAELAA